MKIFCIAKDSHIPTKNKFDKIHCYFLLKNVKIFCIAKDSHIPTKKTHNVFDNVVGIHFNKLMP